MKFPLTKIDLSQTEFIFNKATSIETAYTKLAHWWLFRSYETEKPGAVWSEVSNWHKDVENTGVRAFYTISNTISLNYRSILNYFINRSTNASAESFNAKIKAFRAQFRGVKNVEFFIYRLTTIFA
ncbi:transposase [Arenibacter sp. NBRC 103722]|uniref:transposase n=1 Tax=Arenibacter sp. NBRC 103722 TaxID=1113929 RepID=UPI001F16655B|nr:transposase [Arenibacter sp. NBRC 103722]